MIPNEEITSDDVVQEYGLDVAERIIDLEQPRHDFFGRPRWDRVTLDRLLLQIGVVGWKRKRREGHERDSLRND
jgi:hypothetical protein